MPDQTPDSNLQGPVPLINAPFEQIERPLNRPARKFRQIQRRLPPLLILICFQDETNSGRVLTWQDHVELILRS